MTLQRKKRTRAFLVASTLPLSAAFSRLPTTSPSFGVETIVREPLGTKLIPVLKSDIVEIASSFTRIDRAFAGKEPLTHIDVRPALVSLNFQFCQVTRHLAEPFEKQTVESALEKLVLAGSGHDDIIAALNVAQKIAEATNDVHMTVAALLHGAIGEGLLSVAAVKGAFGNEVGLLVENCASMVELHRHSRELLWSERSMMRLNEEQASHMQNMVILGASDWRVVSLVLVIHAQELTELASRSAMTPSNRVTARESYILAREALDVYAPLAARLGMHALKNELEELGFRHLYPEEHAAVSREIAARYHASKEVLDETLAVLKRALHEDTTFMGAVKKVRFEARAKQPYSVWRKLLKLSSKNEGKATGVVSMDQVLDQLALRVVFELNDAEDEATKEMTRARGEEMCYYVMGLVHEQWSHYDFRVKDYVKHPKPNGYQSLHTTALCRHHGKVWPFEVQVRTVDMHHIAEWGVASHSQYKASSDSLTATPFEAGVAVKWEYLVGGNLEGEPSEVTLGDLVSSPRYEHDSDQASPRKASPVGAATPLPLLSRKGEPEEPLPPVGTIRSEREYSQWLHDALKNTRLYVFVNCGAGKKESTIWDLAVGTSIKDAVWRHRSVSSGNGAVNEAISHLRINGVPVQPDYKLRNGDEVLLL